MSDRKAQGDFRVGEVMQYVASESQKDIIEASDRWTIRTESGLSPRTEMEYLATHKSLDELFGIVPSQTRTSEPPLPVIRNESQNLAKEIEEILLSLRLNRMQTRKLDDLASYLARFPDLAQFLIPISRRLGSLFSRETQFEMEYYYDPETEEEYVIIFVRQSVYEEDIMELLERISAEYDDFLSKSDGWLLITTDFQPPR